MKIYHLILVIIALSCSSGGEKRDPILEKKLENQRLSKEKIKKADESIKDTNLTEDKKNEILLNKSIALLELENYKEALKIQADILQTRSGIRTPHISYYVGLAYFYDKDYKKAIQFLIRSDNEDINFEPHGKRKALAKAFFLDDQFGPGVAILGKASKDKNFLKDQEYYEMVATGFFKMNLFQRSLPIAEEGLTKFPESKALQEIKRDSLSNLEPKKSKS